jgi:hypothetical protein
MDPPILDEDGTVVELTEAERKGLDKLIRLRKVADTNATASVRREIEQYARALAAANKRRETAMRHLSGAVRSAAEFGVPETQLSKLAGVDRMTVRKMLGK